MKIVVCQKYERDIDEIRAELLKLDANNNSSHKVCDKIAFTSSPRDVIDVVREARENKEAILIVSGLVFGSYDAPYTGDNLAYDIKQIYPEAVIWIYSFTTPYENREYMDVIMYKGLEMTGECLAQTLWTIYNPEMTSKQLKKAVPMMRRE